jgi:hypothetical protein
MEGDKMCSFSMILYFRNKEIFLRKILNKSLSSAFFFLYFLLGGLVSAQAQETQPGSACTAGQTNLIRWSGGPETTGVVHLVRCNGSTWQQYMTVLASGNIGMGLSTPSERLEVNGRIRIDDNPSLGSQGCFRYNGTLGRIEFAHDCSNFTTFSEPIWLTGAANDIHYSTGTPEVGIGTATPQYTLDVNGAIRTTSHIVVNATAGAANPTFFDLGDLASLSLSAPTNGEVLTYNGTNWVNSTTAVPWVRGTGDRIYYNPTTPQVGIGKTNPGVALDVVGDINYTGVIVDVSDMRQKDYVRPLEDSLEKLIQLNGFAFKMKNDKSGKIEYGVSAQEVQKVFPEAVRTLDDKGTLGVSYTGLIAPMIEAIKEQQKQIEQLQAEIKELKAQKAKTPGEL